MTIAGETLEVIIDEKDEEIKELNEEIKSYRKAFVEALATLLITSRKHISKDEHKHFAQLIDKLVSEEEEE